ncbi:MULTISPECIES: SDR family NAD(P)-dependent oxidoreductase [Acinetobacter]|jgi:NAD(P)-dependent dehydrogenase (short-subunit alcohol dehydrogenase family)|uniref:SDR family NAD(P)-dependent oxidoreductase n=1 Tax=Acinetobacter TaxID=469 RepID=UPI000B3C83F5|nr:MULTISPECIES: SDR family NAD(P)-dependent oxidoreductase [Acinetobacter]AXY60113.1 SDR family NAD(P)-dependent oxidoreductase [Acinetobacter sp. WCHAc010052]WOE43170.1 SDR family NAD(P)-dependent oxidoreductase [Acinetobacter chinensis]
MIHNKQAVFITGAGSGIGLATTQKFLNEGFFVFGSVIDEQEKEKVNKTFRHDFLPIIMNITQESEILKTFETVQKNIDGMTFRALINIAGVIYNGPLMDVTQSQFEHILAVNTVGVHMMAKTFLPLLQSKNKQRNKIINISSQSGLRTLPFTGIYSASKFALEALSNAMRHEYSVFGIDTCLIEPGQIQTPMAEKIIENVQKKPNHPIYIEPMRIFSERTIASFSTGIPMQKIVDTIFTAFNSAQPKFRNEVHSDFIRDAIIFRKLPIKLQNALIKRTLKLYPA